MILMCSSVCLLSDGEVFLLLLEVLEDKLVVEKFLDMGTIIRVLPEAFVQKISCFLADIDIGGDADLILDYLDQIFFFVDLEGVLPHQHLIGHDTQRPNIYFFVILFALEDLGAYIDGCATEGIPESVIMID